MCHFLRGCIVLSLSLAALCYESAVTIMRLQNDTVKYTAVTELLYSMTYPIKTTLTLAVILVFWWNRRAMSSIFERTLPLHGSSERLGNWAIAFAMFSFLIQSGTRGSDMYSEWTTGKRFYSADLFGLPVTMLEQHAFLLGTRIFTEGVRILCSGYVGMLLNEIRRDLQATSRSISKHTLGSVRAFLTNITDISAARERDIVLAKSTEQQLSVLLITCFLADILSLICMVGELFIPKTLNSRLRLGGSTAMYLFSMFVVCRGLIHLSDEVFGLLLTFCCFVLEQLNDNPHLEASQLNQTTLQEATVNVSVSVYATNCSESF
ncbi:hypothetical protein BV898_15582 [Hypsibius exemplaris]|uniref:Gustatory receptor n=1 Tax=Hypsibius exemplaris TaxID=2072580 RepID=A0A9X6RKM7_HYPEX|nr:hypothetical protein BV898_15582 [Hypsibius exemplaris]